MSGLCCSNAWHTFLPTVLHYSTVGSNVSRNTAMHQQRQGRRRRLQDDKHDCINVNNANSTYLMDKETLQGTSNVSVLHHQLFICFTCTLDSV